jgi:protein ImuB
MFTKTKTAVRAILLECAAAFSPSYRRSQRESNLRVCCGRAGTGGLFGAPSMLAKQIRQRIRSVGIVASVKYAHLYGQPEFFLKPE